MSATISVNNSQLGNALQQLLMCDEIIPGSDVSYQICKAIYSYHVLGRKMVDSPLIMAQSKPRMISVDSPANDQIVKAFEKEWEEINADEYISQVCSVARIYGIGSIAVVCEGIEPNQEIPPEKMAEEELSFNVFDPLNTAGSLVLNQNPNSMDFMKYGQISVSGQTYHRSRTVVLMNERPIYIEYTTSAFGFVGRSVYQRALFPLKSFVNTMVTDDMIATKAGLIVAKIKQPGSIIDAAMAKIAGIKRSLLREARTNNVLSIDIEESIESLNLQNIDGAGTFARNNILKNIATAADMPAKLLENETMVSGFGEGKEDAENIEKYIENIRKWMKPAYNFFDEIVMRRAWNEDFFLNLKKQYPETYNDIDFKTFFFKCKNSFSAVWPSLLSDPESDEKMEKSKSEAITSVVQILLPIADPENKVSIIQWMVDSISTNKMLFPVDLVLDYESLSEFLEEQKEQQEQMAKSAQMNASPQSEEDESEKEHGAAQPKPKHLAAV